MAMATFHLMSPWSSMGPYRPVVGRLLARKMRLRRGRVRCSEAARKRQARKALAVVRQAAADELISSFIGDQAIASEADGDGRSDEEFWSTLDNRDWNTPASLQPVDAHCGRYVPAGFERSGIQTRVARLQAMGLRR